MIDGSRIPLVAAAGGVPGQVAIVVTDIEEAMRLWGADRGPWRVWTYGPAMLPEQTYLGAPSRHSMLLAMNGSDPMLELVQPLDGPSIYHTWLEQGRSGVHHLGYYVDDLDAVTRAMEEAGYPCVQTGSGHGADGTGGFAYFDTLAVLGFYLEAIVAPIERRAPERLWPAGGGAVP
jgi:hypothetical protein